ncbi:hypothetical protein RF11_12979 [Thelohanellus kitauei]|uniref:Uncharacterized protein n=1 Tax=Thelohanellus kitauei TaxID=669202 RepID=A0A0C2IT27_THEKT|nr:hypothetical protein RF11_12979 [Thelohanellus kitauei]
MVRSRSSNTKVILAMNRHNIVNSEVIQGSFITEVFNAFLTATNNSLDQAREEAFSLIKSNLRRISPPSDTRDLISRMNDATCSVIPQHLENFIMPPKSIYGAYLNLEDIGREQSFRSYTN